MTMIITRQRRIRAPTEAPAMADTSCEAITAGMELVDDNIR